jgi:hypothetical protein
MDKDDIMLNLYKDTWALDVPICPCDVHFNDFIAAMKIRNSAIFHFGTGSHHVIGIEAAEDGRKNAVFAITASVGEYDSYVRLITDQPEIGNFYKAYFGDIYQLDARLLPEFDVVTLFHLCEFRTEANDAYGALTDLEMAKLLIDKIRPGGYVLFYQGSMAFEKAVDVIAKLERQRDLTRLPDFKGLQVYRVGLKKSAKKAAPASKNAPKAKVKKNLAKKVKKPAKAKVGKKAKRR